MESQNMVLSSVSTNKYLVVMNDYDIYNAKKNNIIHISNKRDLEIVLFILKEAATVYEPSISDAEIIAWLSGKTYNQILDNLNVFGTEYREFYRVLEKIPITDEVAQGLKENKSLLDKQFVHKQNQKNVLLSRGFKFYNSNLIFFNAFTETEEISLDHTAEDHVEGLLLAEICRQAAIASVNLCMDSSKVFVMIEDKKVYKKFVDRNREIIIKTFAMGAKEGLGFCVLYILQGDKICVKAIMRGQNFLSKAEYINES